MLKRKDRQIVLSPLSDRPVEWRNRMEMTSKPPLEQITAQTSFFTPADPSQSAKLSGTGKYFAPVNQ